MSNVVWVRTKAHSLRAGDTIRIPGLHLKRTVTTVTETVVRNQPSIKLTFTEGLPWEGPANFDFEVMETA